MYYYQLLLLIGTVAMSSATTANGCPDDSYSFKEINGTKRCYKIFTAAELPVRCKFIDYCRPLHPDAIPVSIHSIEERDYLQTLVDHNRVYLTGIYIPCPLEYSTNNYINVDGTPIPAPVEQMHNDRPPEYFVGLKHGRTNDWANDNKNVMCSITLNQSPCPDNSYKYKEINGVGNCYKTYKTPNKIDQCNVINACRSLDPEAIPVTLTSIEQRDYLKTLVDPHVFTLIGVSIPCGHPCNAKAYENVDGTPLPAPLEVTNGGCPKQVLGMLYKNKTDNLDPTNPKFHGDVLCSIPIYFDCPPGTYPDSKDGRITANTNCVQYVPYVPGSTPEETCAKSNSQFKPPTEIPCSLPHSIEHVPPPPLPYCDA